LPTYTCEIDGVSVVLVGHFNPAIIHPAWMARYGLIRSQEAETAHIELVHPQVAAFKIGELRVMVQQDRFELETTALEAGPQLRDLALGIFRLLEHTPLKAMGLNRNMHFRLESEDAWHRIGHQLAPKDAWEGLLEDAGTRNVTIAGRRRGSEALFTVKAEPSVKVHPGVFVGTNQHIEGEGPALLSALADTWETAQRDARRIAEELLERCLNQA
jgi:hypothetical protein